MRRTAIALCCIACGSVPAEPFDGASEGTSEGTSGGEVSTEDSQHTGLITSTQIEQIQVKGRDVTTLMRLVPGVRYEDTVESLGESFGTLVPHVSGQRRDWNTIMIDGVLGNEVGQTNRMAQQINLDAVDEIKVLLNTYRAEYGRGGGAQIQIVTKSGSNRFHGSAYHFLQNEALNANEFFLNRAGTRRPRYRRHETGVTLGGPLIRNRTFFFGSVRRTDFQTGYATNARAATGIPTGLGDVRTRYEPDAATLVSNPPLCEEMAQAVLIHDSIQESVEPVHENRLAFMRPAQEAGRTATIA